MRSGTDTDRICGSPIAHHNRDLHPKTLRSIIRQARLTVDEFVDLL